MIEFRFRSAIDLALVQKAASKLRSKYPREEQVVGVEVKIEDPPQGIVTKEGFKLSSEDGADIVLVKTGAVGTSRLAPYLGWEQFIATAQDNWRTWRKVVDWNEVSRVGLRYINRVDIPLSESSLEVSDYFNISVKLPTDDENHGPYSLQITLPLADGVNVLVNAGAVPSPLVDHSSFVLDLDFGVAKNLPLRDDGLWALLETLRKPKNDMFERFITDRTRALFQ